MSAKRDDRISMVGLEFEAEGDFKLVVLSFIETVNEIQLHNLDITVRLWRVR